MRFTSDERRRQQFHRRRQTSAVVVRQTDRRQEVLVVVVVDGGVTQLPQTQEGQRAVKPILHRQRVEKLQRTGAAVSGGDWRRLSGKRLPRYDDWLQRVRSHPANDSRLQGRL